MKLSLKTMPLLAIAFIACVFSRLNAGDNQWPNIPEEYRAKNLQLGYIALYGGFSITDGLVKTISKSNYSHAALILYDKDVAQFPSAGNSYVYETMLDLGTPVSRWNGSANIYPWNGSWWTQTTGTVSLRAINGANISSDAIKNELNTYLGKPYAKQQALLGLFRANKTQNLSQLYCSQLVALSFQDWGILSQQKLANNYLPGDFSSSSIGLVLLEGVTLDNEVNASVLYSQGQ